MSHRRFSDRAGRRWEIRVRAKGDWEFRPVPGNPEPTRRGDGPLYQTDPFELSEQELQTILAGATPVSEAAEPDARGKHRPAGRLFDWSPPEKKSPFLDDRDDEL